MLDIVLLAGSVVFCATTFARDELFIQAGLSPRQARYILGLAAIAAFFSSLISLRVDWKGRSARHQDAVQKLTRVLSLFNESRDADGNWSQDRAGELHTSYWEAMNNIIEVPAGSFVSLKAKHLRKVETSKLLDSMPGCPLFVIRLIVFWRSVVRSRGGVKGTEGSRK